MITLHTNIILDILSLLNSLRLTTCMLTCERLCILSQDDSVWKSLTLARNPKSIIIKKTWKKTYKLLYTPVYMVMYYKYGELMRTDICNSKQYAKDSIWDDFTFQREDIYYDLKRFYKEEFMDYDEKRKVKTLINVHRDNITELIKDLDKSKLGKKCLLHLRMYVETVMTDIFDDNGELEFINDSFNNSYKIAKKYIYRQF